MAPHGGIFVFPVVGNALLNLVALAVGSAVGCVLLGVFKKKTAKEGARVTNEKTEVINNKPKAN